jgi:hypothetical protein
MKLPLFLLPAIFATTAALADAQTQAAALLNRPHTPVTMTLERSSSLPETAIDAQASAAALLSGHRIARPVAMSAAAREASSGDKPADAHSQAEALLNGTRIVGR